MQTPTLDGLVSDGGAKWNDEVGMVVGFDRAAGRYVLQMSAEDQVRIRPQNLVL